MPPSHRQDTIEVQVRRSAAAGLSPGRHRPGGPDGTRSMWRPPSPMIPEGAGHLGRRLRCRRLAPPGM